jgi:uncharacterized membrane protein
MRALRCDARAPRRDLQPRCDAGTLAARMSRSATIPLLAFRRHPRTWIALAIGIAAAMSLPRSWSFISRTVAGWDCGVVFFLVAIYRWMSRLTSQQLRSRYLEEDPSGPILLVIITAAALLSLLATVQLLATLRHVPHQTQVWHFALAALTLIASWALVPTMFTMHYADLFYSAAAKERPLSFPETELPLFWDFAYFAFTIAAANQTADVLTTRQAIRRVVIAQEIVSFVFNVSILGFAINITAGLIGG